MPDATGTATSPDLIPTYNTAVDPPSGKGFNTAIAAIQTALTNNYSRKPAGLVAGEVPVWNGSAWVRSSATRIINGPAALPSITTSTWAGGPPATPSEGDIWVATAVDGNGTRWTFSWSSTNTRWQFAGGNAVTLGDSSGFAILNVPGGAVKGAGFTARAGFYQILGGSFYGNNNSGATASYGVMVFVAGSLVATLGQTSAAAATLFGPGAISFIISATAGQLIQAGYFANATAAGGVLGLSMVPIYIT